MIFDRKYTDIINARKIFREKIQNFIELSAEEQKIIDKAFFNLFAINRITESMNDIWGFVVALGGTKEDNDDVRTWGSQELFTVTNFSNIRKNIFSIISELKNIGFVDVETHETAYRVLTDEYVYTNLNNLEKLLYDLYSVFEQFAIQVGDRLYIFGAYDIEFSEGELTIG